MDTLKVKARRPMQVEEEEEEEEEDAGRWKGQQKNPAATNLGV